MYNQMEILVVLIKDLKAKGSSMVAKQGNICTTSDWIMKTPNI
jgi:uncharacterized Zn ribbon protein